MSCYIYTHSVLVPFLNISFPYSFPFSTSGSSPPKPRPYALHLITESQILDATACSILISAYGKASKWREVIHFLSRDGDGILVVSQLRVFFLKNLVSLIEKSDHFVAWLPFYKAKGAMKMHEK